MRVTKKDNEMKEVLNTGLLSITSGRNSDWSECTRFHFFNENIAWNGHEYSDKVREFGCSVDGFDDSMVHDENGNLNSIFIESMVKHTVSLFRPLKRNGRDITYFAKKWVVEDDNNLMTDNIEKVISWLKYVNGLTIEERKILLSSKKNFAAATKSLEELFNNKG